MKIMIVMELFYNQAKGSSYHPSKVHSSDRAAITRDHRLGGSNIKNLFFHSSRSWEPKIKVLTA